MRIKRAVAKSVALLAFVLASGCAPLVQHAPWVRRGVSATAGGSAGLATDFVSGTAASPFVSLDAGLRVGAARSDSARTGAALGLQLPLLSIALVNDVEDPLRIAEFLSVDGYIAFPLITGIHTAAGFTRSSYHNLPYIQVGEYERWFGTLALMSMRRSDVVLVVPSFTSLDRLNSGTVLQLTAMAGVGQDHGETIVMFGFGMLFEFHRKHARP